MNKRLKWLVLRMLWLIIVPPLAGIACSRMLNYAEGVIRAWLEKPALMGASDGVLETLDPMFMVLFVLFCWFLVEPLSAILALTLSLEEREHPIMAAVATAAIFWLLAALVFYRPDLDAFPLTLFATGIAMGLPLFCSALATAYAVTPNKRRLRTLGTRVRSA